MCENDLTALVNWGNLIAIQDTNNVTTVEEFKHRKFRYQLSPYAVEIERLVIKLENLHIEGGSLEPMLVERIKEALISVERISKKTEIEVHGWWKNLNDDFKRLNQGYQDYIKTFYTVKKICEMFCRTETIEEAHKLSSLVFGMFNTRHTKGNFVRETDSINSSLLHENSNSYEVKPRIREYKEKMPKVAIQDKTAEKKRQIELYMMQLEQERKEIEKYIKDGKIDIQNLPVIKSSFRKTLLKWISKAGLTSSHEIVIEDGRKIRLVYPENKKRCMLTCEDGTMEMPAFILEFVN